MKLTVDHIDEVIRLVRKAYPDAEPSMDKYDWEFQDSCGCYSEYTTESCFLRVGLVIPRKLSHIDRRRIEDMVTKWAKATLTWDGCSCCENGLYVSAHIYDEDQ
jgi:hypothetical protein